MNIGHAEKEAAEILAGAGISDPKREARTLLTSAIGRDLAFVFAHPEYELEADELGTFITNVGRRSKREPLQYVLGKQEFFGLEFFVNSDVLIPRPETELLVETAIIELGQLPEQRFCEVGIGSGCVSVALLNRFPEAHAVAIDISKQALAVAEINARRHCVIDRLDLRNGDLFGDISGGLFDLIVSNPPYVSAAEFSGLQPEVRGYEPAEALTDKADGLSIVRRLIAESPRLLKFGGVLLIEIGFGQADAVAGCFEPSVWACVERRQDLRSIDRVIRGVLR